ncbi:hypothetical protein [Clostridium estertheticum]|uniref:Uncharacterized protein n=1 Tax=Clostridium estertheticum subsp. estertheticum TaxID=1552 RepID=A0A1J0GBZ8_9CLOT|nr:hypothetical protein [Clostridium estertheticum]APC38803.1 hypothetical protein A7L45_01330 [Clostridium estertheticum subsp. estertheticum]MBZ9615256.1 hypothetical protein [Clostridium estertheticum subsp. laramiense]WAG75145.1 hypothetical protein LL032_06770 [Clostridium estertheticum]
MSKLKSRVYSFIVSISMLAFILPTSEVSAQTLQAKTLSDALTKTSMATSSESNGKLSLKLNGEGLSKSEQQQFTQVSKMLNNLQVVFNSKTAASKEGKISKQYIKTIANVGGTPYNAEVWSDMNVKGKNVVAKEIVKSPQLFKMMSQSKNINKYMIMDFPQGENGSIDFKKMMSGNKELQKLILTITQKYSSQLNLKGVVTKDGNVYKVKIDDAKFKEIIRKVVNITAENKEIQGLIKNYVVTSMKNSGSSTKDINNTKIQMEQMFTKIQSQKFLDAFNKNMDKLDNIKILGNKGIEIAYTIDKNGYVIGTKGNIEIVIDAAKLEKAFGTTGQSALKGIYTADIKFEVNNKNINKKVNVKLPKITAKNSFNYTELINGTQQTQKVEAPNEVIKSSK